MLPLSETEETVCGKGHDRWNHLLSRKPVWSGEGGRKHDSNFGSEYRMTWIYHALRHEKEKKLFCKGKSNPAVANLLGS